MTLFISQKIKKNLKIFRRKIQIPKRVFNSDAQYYFGFKLFLQVILANTEHLSSKFFESYRMTLNWKWNEELSLEMFKLVEHDRETTI